MHMKSHNHSLSTAYLSGELQGPPGQIVDADTGVPIEIGSQDFGHTHSGREVILGQGLPRGYVIDVQHPADTPHELRQPDVDYSAHEAQLRNR